MAIARKFIPWGELKPDGREFNNDGLAIALNVVPFCGSYVPSQYWASRKSSNLAALPTGFWAHASALAWYGYYGTDTKLYELSATDTTAWTETDKTRLAGGNYSAAAVTGWQGASFGDSVVMTNFTDDPQLLTSPAAANFVKLATTAGGTAGAGMDPRARFAFPVRGNMFLAYLTLPTALLRPDATTELAAGTYPQHVCWSASDNVRAYGSFVSTPALVGTGFQPLNYDLGYITGGIGGEYGLVFLQRGVVRVDGPPYQFRPIVQGIGCQYPNSIVRFDDDVYFWGPAGPMVLRGGEGPAVPLTTNKLARALTDIYVSPGEQTFSSTIPSVPANEFAVAAAADTAQISAAPDNLTRTVWWSYVSRVMQDLPIIVPCRSLTYSVDDDRFSWQSPCDDATADSKIGLYYLRSVPTKAQAASWLPGRDIAGIRINADSSGQRPVMLSTGATVCSSRLVRGYVQLDPNLTTRVRRVRPIYSGAAVSVSLTVYSKNRPTDSSTLKGPFTTIEDHGWIPTPGTYTADWHRLDLTVSTPTVTTSTTVTAVGEMEGVEVEFETGGVY